MLFTYKQIANLNATETSVYQYVIKNIPAVIKMSIRDLAAATHVSTATIVRFCQKLECQGFVEFKTKLKLFNEGLLLPDIDDEIDVINEFFNYARSDDFKKAISQFVDYVQSAQTITFLGIGTSGLLGKFGARYFSNVGYFSQGIDDPYWPPPVNSDSSHLLIVLSESGETREIIDQIKMYQQQNTKIVSIINKPNTTIGNMSDLSINYYVKDIILPQTYNISSQIPVLYILERVTRELQNSQKRSLPLKFSSRNL
ncbi:MurR/RpiR family transcriptional regulator [uncultured Thomasclavelia sp.]|uniref:MurR/RpiR family transcriptional regulator n=1 Tax=uncultured Thomasclavelia sp. TaxID=3025759 RepID=UPI0025F50EA3|nr:MurR/RpiR family transcriptional regulator [uncultured Thomasclavelia sp.]